MNPTPAENLKKLVDVLRDIIKTVPEFMHLRDTP